MKTKEEIVANWLPRYTKRSLNDFGEYILLTNFNKYVELFADKFNVPVLGRDANMTSAHAEGITIINFGMGSPNAAIIMDLLGAIQPKACLFLRQMWGHSIGKISWGDLEFYPLQLFVEKEHPMIIIRLRYLRYLHLCCSVPFRRLFATMPAIIGLERYILPTAVYGSMMKSLKSISLKRVPCVWIWKRLRCLLLVFYNHIPTGALLLVSDQPMIPEGVKTEKSDSIVTQQYVEEHVEIGIASLQMIIEEKKTVKHLKF